MRALKFSLAVLAGMYLLIACQKDDTSLSDPLVITIISGNYQPGENGDKLNDPIVVRATNTDGNPLQNISLSFEIIDGSGRVENSKMQTNAEGLAETFWILGTGTDHVMKVSITDQEYPGDPVYLFAQTKVEITINWVSDVNFPRLYNRTWAHDKRVLETNHYLVFSDESSDDAKVRFAKIAEEILDEVIKTFNVQNCEDFGISETNKYSKPRLFSNVNTDFPYGGFAFKTGYVYYALDCQTYLSWPQSLKDIYRLDVIHETVHLISFLAGLDNLPNLWPDVWFSEGIAVYISNNRPPPANTDELNAWRSIPANDNPIKVHEWEDLPSGGRQYYNMFGLAVEYLLSENGHGKTTTDVLEMYRYMFTSKEGFAKAFEIHMGMSLQYYEDNYWDLVTEFLAKRN